jgi:hypothetical protein
MDYTSTPIRPKASLRVRTTTTAANHPIATGLNVTCSCPAGERQKFAPLKSGKIIVCKHGAAVLELAFGKEAVTTLKREVKRHAKRRRTEQDAWQARKKKRRHCAKLKRRKYQENVRVLNVESMLLAVN